MLFDLISRPWPWYVAGPLIALTLVMLTWWGKLFGVSKNFQNIGAMCGAGKLSDYFRYDWREQKWNLAFAAGTVIGGFIAYKFLGGNPAVDISASTVAYLQSVGVNEAGGFYEPSFFSWEGLATPKGFILLVVGGFLVGFGTRYAQGCTSGHAISGLSNFQWPSLIATVGFFIGGLFTTWFVLPYLLKL